MSAHLECWRTQYTTLLQIAWYCAQQPLRRSYKLQMVDRALRAASDILSSETTRVHNNTGSCIQWCLLWTHSAQKLYLDNRQSTHRKTCDLRHANSKRFFSVEHPHPLKTVKTDLLDGMDYDTLVEWMESKGRAVIVTQDELAILPQLGEDRYEKLNIRYSRFDPGAVTRTR